MWKRRKFFVRFRSFPRKKGRCAVCFDTTQHNTYFSATFLFLLELSSRLLIAEESSMSLRFCFIYAASSLCHVPYFSLLFWFFDVGEDVSTTASIISAPPLSQPPIPDLRADHLRDDASMDSLSAKRFAPRRHLNYARAHFAD